MSLDFDILKANSDNELRKMGIPIEVRVTLPWDKVDPNKSFDENLQMLLNYMEEMERKREEELKKLLSEPMNCLFNHTYANLEKDLELIIEECMECKRLKTCLVPRTIGGFYRYLTKNEWKSGIYRRMITRLVRQALKKGEAPIVITKAGEVPIGKYIGLNREDVVLFVSPSNVYILKEVDPLEKANIEKQGYDYIVGKYGGKYRFM